jgi:hypothetical protein
MKSLNLNFSNNYTDRTDLVFNTKRFHHLNYLNNIIYTYNPNHWNSLIRLNLIKKFR